MVERVDKKKNEAKVVKEVLANPLQSQREIATNAWVWLGTVNRHIKKMEQTGTKDDRILGITDKDLQIVTLVQDQTLDDLLENKLKPSDRIKAAELSTKRYTLFRWDVTDSE